MHFMLQWLKNTVPEPQTRDVHLVHRLANTLAFERRCRGPVPGRVSSRDKGDPRRGGQAQERARRRTVSTPHKRGTSTPDAARGSLVAAEKAALLATGACGSVCTATPLSASPAPAPRAPRRGAARRRVRAWSAAAS